MDTDVLRRFHLLVAIGGVCVGLALVVAMLAGFPRDPQPGDIGFFFLILAGLCPQVVPVGPLATLVWSRAGRAVRGMLVALGALLALASLMMMLLPVAVAPILIFASARFARAFPRAWLVLAILCILVGLATLVFFLAILLG
jgi:hypothetical protein